MSRNGQPGLAINTLLTQIDVLLWTAVYDLNVDALCWTGAYVGGDDDEGVGMGGVPDAFCGGAGTRGGE